MCSLIFGSPTSFHLWFLLLLISAAGVSARRLFSWERRRWKSEGGNERSSSRRGLNLGFYLAVDYYHTHTRLSRFTTTMTHILSELELPAENKWGQRSCVFKLHWQLGCVNWIIFLIDDWPINHSSSISRFSSMQVFFSTWMCIYTTFTAQSVWTSPYVENQILNHENVIRSRCFNQDLLSCPSTCTANVFFPSLRQRSRYTWHWIRKQGASRCEGDWWRRGDEGSGQVEEWWRITASLFHNLRRNIPRCQSLSITVTLCVCVLAWR